MLLVLVLLCGVNDRTGAVLVLVLVLVLLLCGVIVGVVKCCCWCCFRVMSGADVDAIFACCWGWYWCSCVLLCGLGAVWCCLVLCAGASVWCCAGPAVVLLIGVVA